MESNGRKIVFEMIRDDKNVCDKDWKNVENC